MPIFKKICFVSICAFVLGFTPYQTLGKSLLTIEQAVQEALNKNPHLKAKEANVEASKARIGQARSLDDPVLGVQFYDVPINTLDINRGMETNYSITQKLPFPSKLITKGTLAKKNYLMEQKALETEKIDILVQTEHAFHDLYLLEKSLQINQELQSVFKRFEASEEARYETGNKTSQNFLKARLELEKLQTEALLFQAKQIQTQATLNILRDRRPGEEIYLAELPREDHPLPSYETLEKEVLERHPELKMARLQKEASKANVSLMRQEAVIPDLQAGFTYNQRFGQVDAWTAEAMVNIPFVWGKNRKALKEALARRQASEEEFLNIQNEKLSMLKEAYAKLESAKQSEELYRKKVLPSAALALKSAEAAYETGKEDFLTLLDAARSFKEAKLGALEAFVDYHRAMTHLKLASGLEVL